MGNLKGAGWMTLAMGLYAIVDSCIKLATETLPKAQVLVAIGIVGLVAFSLAAKSKGLKPLPLQVFQGAALMRGVFDAGASVLFVFALRDVDLSLFTTIVQANPLLVVLGAAIFLGEPVGWRRWTAILIGLCGVLIVLRPTGDSFTPAAILVVLGVILQASRDLITRVVNRDIHTLQLSAAAFVALIVAGFIQGVAQNTPPLRPEGMAWLYLGGACFLFIPAVYAMVAAMRVGDVSFVAPFRYTRIVFGLALGVIIFRETLDGWTLLGAAIIVGSGLYSFWRETQAKRRASLSNPETL
ncbi:DMT family transporter [Marivivens marinus]|uniref:DMT family transporter n=1 Tax=Marivivens marinus TaxID=3110173 RepID=UPI003B846798